MPPPHLCECSSQAELTVTTYCLTRSPRSRSGSRPCRSQFRFTLNKDSEQSFCGSPSPPGAYLLVLVLGFPAARHPRRGDIAGDDRDLVQWHVHPSGGKSGDAHTRTSCPAARAKGMMVPAEAPLPAGDTEISHTLRNKAVKAHSVTD